MMYATVNEHDTITDLSDEASDQDAQRWYDESRARRRGGAWIDPETLVVLDLAGDEGPEIGDEVEVDDEGVATLVTGRDYAARGYAETP